MHGHRIPRLLRRVAVVAAVAAGLVAVTTVSAQERVRVALGEVPPDDVMLQQAAGADGDGPLRVAELAADRPLVLLWWSVRSPVCERYAANVRSLVDEVRETADVVLVVTAADSDSDTLAAGLARQELGSVRVLRDVQGAAARFAVRVTPTALVLGADGALRYRGPIDDDRRARGRDAHALLLPAVRAVAAGREVEPAEARPFGSALR